MLWCFVLTVALAAVSGQRVLYDGTPLEDDVFVLPPIQQSQPVFPQPQPVLPQPQALQPLLFSQPLSVQPLPFFPQPQPVQPQPQPVQPLIFSQSQPVQPLLFSQPQPVLPQPQPVLPQSQPLRPLLFSQPQSVIPQPVLPQPQPVQPLLFSQPQSVIPQPVQPQPAPRGLVCGPNPGSVVHRTRGNSEYHFSWCGALGPLVALTHSEAKTYCRSLPSDGNPMGFRLLSIEDQAEDSDISGMMSSNLVPYIWTSGERSPASMEFRWHGSFALQYTNWSHTGRQGRPQPDNDEGDEYCIALLNNVYMDGVTWHDLGCSHRKFVVCERARVYGS